MAAPLADKLWDISDIVKLIERWELGATEGNPVRCYFMKDGHIAGVEYLTATEDQARIDEARKLFEATGRTRGADGFEVWDGPRFISRYPELPLQPEVKL